MASEHGPVRKLLETLKNSAQAMGFTLEQAADVIDFVIKIRGEAPTTPESMQAVAESAKKWVQ